MAGEGVFRSRGSSGSGGISWGAYAVGAIILLIVVMVIVAIVLMVRDRSTLFRVSSRVSTEISTAKSFESEFASKLEKDPNFLVEFEKDPKGVLEREVSAYLGKPFKFEPHVRVEAIKEDPNLIHVIIPSETKIEYSALDQLLDATLARRADEALPSQPKVVYGKFMGSLKGVFWRVGVDEGSCYSDILAELDRIKAGTQLQDCV